MAEEKETQEENVPVIIEVPESEEEAVKSDASEKSEERKEELPSWNPRTTLGKQVKAGIIKDIDALLDSKGRILEVELIDMLISLKTDLIAIGQSKGKFGGGKKRAWRQTQRKTAEGNVSTFACMSVVGDEAGHVGLGYGKSKETLPAKEKALRNAKINLIKVKRGCGSFDCLCNEPHSIPFKVKGKCGSAEMILMPAPKGTGLVIEGECKKILGFAGIKDIYSRTFGQTRTKINLAKACFEALKKTSNNKKGKEAKRKNALR
ncbi:MAG: 30S ribosomal protein S5 [archaeon]